MRKGEKCDENLWVVLAVVGSVAGLTDWFAPSRALAARTKGYQAVLLDNERVYFGKLEVLGRDYRVLTDMFYIDTAINPETKQQNDILFKAR